MTATSLLETDVISKAAMVENYINKPASSENYVEW